MEGVGNRGGDVLQVGTVSGQASNMDQDQGQATRRLAWDVDLLAVAWSGREPTSLPETMLMLGCEGDWETTSVVDGLWESKCRSVLGVEVGEARRGERRDTPGRLDASDVLERLGLD